MKIFILTIFCLLILLYLFAICPRLTKKKNMARLHHTMFTHRGYHCADRLIPENSMAAFKAALDHGYGIELDIHLTRDGQIAVFHDDDLERICHVSGKIESYTFEELQQFHLLNTSERIPLLSDVLTLVNGRVPLLIELKIPGRSLKLCQAAYTVLKDYKGVYLIQSFHTLGILWFRLHAPHVLRGQLSSNLTASDPDKPWFLTFPVRHLLSNWIARPDFISYKMKDLPNLSVSLCRHLFGITVAVWTLRTESALKQGLKSYHIQIFEKKAENY